MHQACSILHLDVWTPDDFNLQVTPINSAPGTGVTEILVPITYTTGSWTSVDIPIGDFTGMNWDNVIQIKFDGGNGSEAFFCRQHLFLETFGSELMLP